MFSMTLKNKLNGTNICMLNPSICYNGGTCHVNSSLLRGFSCTCPPPTTGLYCEQIINNCELDPMVCLNNGTCIALSSGYYRCNCAPGYGGTYCQYSKLI